MAPPGKTFTSPAAISSTGRTFTRPLGRTSVAATAFTSPIDGASTLPPDRTLNSLTATALSPSTGGIFTRPPNSTSNSLAATTFTSCTGGPSTRPPGRTPASLVKPDSTSSTGGTPPPRTFTSLAAISSIGGTLPLDRTSTPMVSTNFAASNGGPFILPPTKTSTSLAATASTGATFAQPTAKGSTSMAAKAFTSSTGATSAQPPAKSSTSLAAKAFTSSTSGASILPPDRIYTSLAANVFASTGGVFTLTPGGTSTSLASTDFTSPTGIVFIQLPSNTPTSIASTSLTRGAFTLPPGGAFTLPPGGAFTLPPGGASTLYPGSISTSMADTALTSPTTAISTTEASVLRQLLSTSLSARTLAVSYPKSSNLTVPINLTASCGSTSYPPEGQTSPFKEIVPSSSASISPEKQLEIERNLSKELSRSISSDNLDSKNNCTSKRVSCTPSKLSSLPLFDFVPSVYPNETDLSETSRTITASPSSRASISPDNTEFDSSCTRTSLSAVVHDLPTNVKQDLTAKRMPASPTGRMFDSPAKRMHLSPTKHINIFPTEGIAVKPDPQFTTKYPTATVSIGEAEDHSNVIRPRYETEHTSENKILTSQPPFRPNVNDITRILPSYEERTGSQVGSHHPEMTVQAKNNLQDAVILNLPSAYSIDQAELYSIGHISGNQLLTSQPTLFQRNVSDITPTLANYGEQIGNGISSRLPKMALQADENILKDAVSLNSVEGSFTAGNKTSSDAGYFSPGAQSFSFEDSDSPRCPRKSSSFHASIPPISNAVAYSTNYDNAIAAKGNNRISIDHSRIMPTQLPISAGYADKFVSRHEYESSIGPTGSIDVIQDKASVRPLRNLEATSHKPITYSGAITPNLSVGELGDYCISPLPQHRIEYLAENKTPPIRSHPVGHYDSSAGLTVFNVGQASDGITEENGHGGSVFPRHATSTKYDPHVSIKYSEDMVAPSASLFKDRSSNYCSQREKESLTESEIRAIQSASSPSDNCRASIRNPVDETLFVVQTSAHLALISILRRCRSNGYTASRETDNSNEIFANETQNLLMKLPENVAFQCKSFILRFLCQALNTVLEG